MKLKKIPVDEPVSQTSVAVDKLLEKANLKNDAALCRALRVSAPTISKLRNGHLPPSSSLILRIHETFKFPVSEIRSLFKL